MAYNYAGRYGDLAIPFSGTKPGQRIARSIVPMGIEIPDWRVAAPIGRWRRLVRLALRFWGSIRFWS